MRGAIIIILLAGLFYTFYFLYSKDQQKDVVYDTDVPVVTSIYKKTVATGSINPREEIELKPRVSGVITKIYVEAGQMVKKGDKIALIKIIPNVVQLNQAENRVKTAELNLSNAKLSLERNQLLLEKKAITVADFERIELNYQLAEEELTSANNNLQLVKEGALQGSSTSNNIVKATVAGMILDVPVKEGASVIESNNFNDGTTVVTVANMDDMIFEGFVDESEVGKLHEGMELSVQIGAIEDQRFSGVLEYISPKGTVDQGTIQFEIRAAMSLKDEVFVRAGYSANAEIVLDQRSDVLAINEGLLLFEGDKYFVEVETADQVFEKREVTLGLSDGLVVEVLSGINNNDHLKIQEAYGKKYR
ncbi:efflux RND transporter periplasmic adaptor subunit [bacterium]|nr:efflux RND transporter periplasmic adaptor subunit [bacterium]